MNEYDISSTDKLVCFGQLLGMCDQVSFSLGSNFYILTRQSRKLTFSICSLDFNSHRLFVIVNAPDDIHLVSRSVRVFCLQVHAVRPGRRSVAVFIPTGHRKQRHFKGTVLFLIHPPTLVLSYSRHPRPTTRG